MTPLSFRHPRRYRENLFDDLLQEFRWQVERPALVILREWNPLPPKDLRASRPNGDPLGRRWEARRRFGPLRPVVVVLNPRA
jgi:hypothetical protein